MGNLPNRVQSPVVSETNDALIMWQDPVVQETRALREHYAQQFNHDPLAIYEDIVKRQTSNVKLRQAKSWCLFHLAGQWGLSP